MLVWTIVRRADRQTSVFHANRLSSSSMISVWPSAPSHRSNSAQIKSKPVNHVRSLATLAKAQQQTVSLASLASTSTTTSVYLNAPMATEWTMSRLVIGPVRLRCHSLQWLGHSYSLQPWSLATAKTSVPSLSLALSLWKAHSWSFSGYTKQSSCLETITTRAQSWSHLHWSRIT